MLRIAKQCYNTYIMTRRGQENNKTKKHEWIREQIANMPKRPLYFILLLTAALGITIGAIDSRRDRGDSRNEYLLELLMQLVNFED
jgi:hypothetical protein